MTNVVLLSLLFFTLNLKADVKFLNSTIVESKGKDIVSNGGYIAPNEGRHDVYIPFLADRKGVFISLGTIRTFNESVFGDFSYVFMVDYDVVACSYNKLLIELFKYSEDRRVFLSYLSRGEKNQDFINRISSIKDADKNSIPEFPSIPAKELAGKWKKNLPNFTDKEKVLKVLSNVDDVGNGLKLKLLESTSQPKNVLGIFVEDSTFSKTILGSDELFNKARRYAQGNRYIVILGNIGILKTMYSIAAAINGNGLSIGAIDFSNAVQYLYVEELLVLRDFLDNVKFSAEGNVLFTATTTFKEPKPLVKEQLFKYYAMDPRAYSDKIISYYLEQNADLVPKK